MDTDATQISLHRRTYYPSTPSPSKIPHWQSLPVVTPLPPVAHLQWDQCEGISAQLRIIL